MKGLAFLVQMVRPSPKAILPGLVIAVFAAPLAVYGFGHFHFRAAQRALVSRDFATAQEHLGWCLKVWFCSTEAHLLAARTARRAGAYSDAEQYLRTCRALGAPTESVDLEFKFLSTQRGDLSHESYLMSRVLENHPDTTLILEVLTKAYAKAYQLVSAQDCVRRWLEREPEDVLAWTWQGQLAQDGLDNAKAIDAYARILELDPDNDAARLVLANLLINAKPPPEALEHFQRLRRRLGDVPAVLVGLATCERALGHPDEARRLLNIVLTAEPQNWAALAERGRLALEHESPQHAENWFRQAVALTPFEKDVNYGLYQCLVRLRKDQEAESVLAKLKRSEADLDRLRAVLQAMGQLPHHPALRCEVGQILIRNGQEEAGVRWLHSALAEDPRHVAAHQTLAEYYERTGNSEQAAAHRRPALAH
jgi:predicted Zn-dependent protease